jgi:hypothetical protein
MLFVDSITFFSIMLLYLIMDEFWLFIFLVRVFFISAAYFLLLIRHSWCFDFFFLFFRFFLTFYLPSVIDLYLLFIKHLMILNHHSLLFVDFYIHSFLIVILSKSICKYYILKFINLILKTKTIKNHLF